MSISEQLKIARKQAGLTQDRVSEITGINKKTISNWETGTSRPDVDNVGVLCDSYKISPNEIFEWNDTKEGKKLRLLHLFNDLNNDGKEAAIMHLELLNKSGDYKAGNQEKINA